MAETEAPHVRLPEHITINVLRIRHLRGSKGDTVTAMVKVEFAEKALGESAKVECIPDAAAELNFSTTLTCTYDDHLVLEEIAHKPVVLTIIEVLPKEKRQKEEKTAVLGQTTIDLLPLILGQLCHRITLTINSVPGSPLETAPPEAPRPEVDVSISVNEPLLDEHQLKEGNLISITVESMFSPPESWQMQGAQFFYTAALPVPSGSEPGLQRPDVFITGKHIVLPAQENKENVVVFPNGQLKPGADKELPNKQKKWPVPGTALGNSIFIPDRFIVSEPTEDEDGDFKGKEDREHRHVSESDKLRVTWNTERRCYLESSAVKGFQDSIAKCRYWPIEIFRLPQPSGGKGGGKKDDDATISFHGVSFLNLAPLLYPGVKRIHGAFKVLPYTDYLLHEKTKRKTGISEDAVRLALNQLNRNSASPPPKKGGKEKADLDKKDAKKGRSNSVMQGHEPPEGNSAGKASSTLKSETGSDTEGQPPVNVEGQLYADAKAYIMIDITLTQPLVPKRPPEEMARRVAELIPPRPAFPKRSDTAEKAVEDYHNQVASVAALVLEEFRDMFGEELKKDELQTNEAMEEKRHKLMYHLNSSGKYFAFKEQLKHSVIKIVREKYLKTTNFDDRQQLQTFLSELYVYLVDQMHESLNKVLQIEDQPPIPAPLTTNAQLKHFAREAEVNREFELATKYYQERIIREEGNADNWFDFGTFCLYINDISKAEECFHKCISINQRHMDGLLLYGVVCTLAERNESAETFFEAATNVDPKSILAWTMMGLFYDTISNDIGAEMAYLEANKLNMARALAIARAAREEELEKERKEKAEREKEVKDMEVPADMPAVEGSAEQMVRSTEGGLIVPTLDITESSPLGHHSPISARSSANRGEAKRNPSSKRERPHEALHEKPPVAPTHAKPSAARKSLLQSRPGSQVKGSARGTPIGGDGEHHQEEMPPREVTPVPTMSIYMQAVEWLLEVKAVPFTEQALAHELLTSPIGKTSAFHIATARLKLQKEEYEEAEGSLNAALQVEHQNPDVWALMGHVNYLKGDTESAMECYERTLSFVTDASETHSIYLRLASIYLQTFEFQKAKNIFLMACKRSPSCFSWLGVGIACYRLDELGEAEDALMEANILNNSNPVVWGYLSLVCLHTSRKVEAEQSYKHAIKLQLQDAALLSEILAEQKRTGFGNPEF